jgi:hypothetical protein
MPTCRSVTLSPSFEERGEVRGVEGQTRGSEAIQAQGSRRATCLARV